MGLIYITIVMLILSIVVTKLTKHKYDYMILDMISFVSGFFATMTLITSIVLILGKQNRVDNIKTNYNSLVELTQNHRSDFTKDIERAGLIQELHETNKRINLHRTYINCKWSSVFYSEEIANLKLLK